MLQLDDVIRDVRENEEWLKIVNKEEWANNPISRFDIYKKKAGNRTHANVDAERWPLTITSYKNYLCFSFSDDDKPEDGKYYFCTKDFYIHYVKRDGTNIRVQADLLTNPDYIKERYRKEIWNENEKSIFEAFFRVAYTVGNFCPIWKNGNPTGNPNGSQRIEKDKSGYVPANVKDTCWAKLDRSGFFNKDIKGIEGRENYGDDLRKRCLEDLFLIVPLENGYNSYSLIRDMYFQDYYNFNWQLKYKYFDLSKCADKKDFVEMVKNITVLIVQRGYRIVTQYRGNSLSGTRKQEIMELLTKVGIQNAKCIYSNKKSR